MKVRISATVDKEKEVFLDRIVKEGKYRNKSHAIEEAIEMLMEGKSKK